MKHGRLASEVPKGFFRAVFGVPRMRASVCSVVALQYAFPLNPLKNQKSTCGQIFRNKFSKYDNCAKQRVSPSKNTTPLGCPPIFHPEFGDPTKDLFYKGSMGLSPKFSTLPSPLKLNERTPQRRKNCFDIRFCVFRTQCNANGR